jgi:hypothetical protein
MLDRFHVSFAMSAKAKQRPQSPLPKKVVEDLRVDHTQLVPKLSHLHALRAVLPTTTRVVSRGQNLLTAIHLSPWFCLELGLSVVFIQSQG